MLERRLRAGSGGALAKTGGGAVIAAVLFDFGGTLDACGVTWKERFQRGFAEEGLDLAPQLFDPAFYAADDALVGAVPRNFGFDDTVQALARGVASNLGADSTLAGRVAARFLGDARPCLGSSAALLANLRPRYALGIVSNFYGNLGAVCADTGLAPHLGAMIDSTVVGATKPDPAIFRAALDRLGVAPSAALFVGDSPGRDMAGARALGMPHVLLAPGGEGCCPGDRVIASLDELPGILG